MMRVLFLMFIFSSTLQAAESVRVRLDAHLSKIEISGLGLQIRGVQSKRLLIALPREQKSLIQRVKINNQWLWQVEQTTAGQRRIFFVAEKYLFIKALSDIQSENKNLPREIFFFEEEGSHAMSLVAVMDIEDYLTGVVSSEMPLHWPLEALKAQAIAARSYALAKVHERPEAIFHLESSTLDQVFKLGRLDDKKMNMAIRAVHETKGIFLYNPKNKIYKAYYHADCGGFTSAASNVWGEFKGMGSAKNLIRDPYCEFNKKSAWSYFVSESDMNKALSKFYDMPNVKIVSIDKSKFGPERVFDFRVAFNNDITRTLLGHDLRSIFGFTKIKSTHLDVISRPNGFEFVGKGSGHGVGLCQSGSRFLALEGKTYLDILQHYYPETHLLNTSQNSERKEEHSAKN